MIDTLKIDYHLSYYRSACHQLTQGVLPPKEFDRVDVIRKAALVAIALEIGVVQEIGNAELDRTQWEAVIRFLHGYENQEQAAGLISFNFFWIDFPDGFAICIEPFLGGEAQAFAIYTPYGNYRSYSFSPCLLICFCYLSGLRNACEDLEYFQ